MTDEQRSTEPVAGRSQRPPTRRGSAGRPAGQRPSRRAATGASRPTAARPASSFLERNGRLLLAAAAVVALVAIGAFVATSAAQPAYACSQQWTAPVSTDPPAPGASARIGYVQPDLGRSHVATGQRVTYALCPPASGNHYNANNLGPIKPQVYGPDDPQIPQGWIHNLEHGGLVILYRCPGDLCSDAGQATLRQLFQDFPNSPVCGFPPTQTLSGVVIARFDDMAYPMVALLWGQILPLQSLDQELIKAFYQQQAERTNPEPVCPRPTATPAPTSATTPAATGTPEPSSPAPSSPGESPTGDQGASPTPG